MIGSPINDRPRDLFEVLRDDILSGELRPNEPLIEADLAERLNVSRTPIREALQRLSAVNLVVARRRGWAVREFTAEEARQRSEIRVALEGYAAYLAAERATEEELERCQKVHLDRLSVDPADEDRRIATNREFHETIIAAARNENLRDAILETGRFYLNHPVARTTSRDEMALANIEHGQILDGLMRRDPIAAEQAMRNHIRRTFLMSRNAATIQPA